MVNLKAVKNIKGVDKVIERAKSGEGLDPNFATPGDLFVVKSKSDAERLIAKGAATEFVVEKKTSAKKEPAKKDADDLGLD